MGVATPKIYASFVELHGRRRLGWFQTKIEVEHVVYSRCRCPVTHLILRCVATPSVGLTPWSESVIAIGEITCGNGTVEENCFPFPRNIFFWKMFPVVGKETLTTLIDKDKFWNKSEALMSNETFKISVSRESGFETIWCYSVGCMKCFQGKTLVGWTVCAYYILNYKLFQAHLHFWVKTRTHQRHEVLLTNCLIMLLPSWIAN